MKRGLAAGPRRQLPVMPIHAAMSSRFPLLESVPSMQALVEDPAYAQVRAAVRVPPRLPGARGERPLRRGAGPARRRACAGLWRVRRRRHADRPCLVWMHGGGFVAGNLDMPEADWTARELALRAGAVVVSVDYRLCNDGVHFPVPHDDVLAAVALGQGKRGGPGHRRGPDLGRRRERGSEPGGGRRAAAPGRGRAPAAHLIFAYGVAHHVIPPMSADHAALMRGGARAAQVPAGGDELPQREFSRRSH